MSHLRTALIRDLCERAAQLQPSLELAPRWDGFLAALATEAAASPLGLVRRARAIALLSEHVTPDEA